MLILIFEKWELFVRIKAFKDLNFWHRSEDYINDYNVYKCTWLKILENDNTK